MQKSLLCPAGIAQPKFRIYIVKHFIIDIKLAKDFGLKSIY
ncbi:hypothetical protein DSUL_20286 [Desulfovibrionales bacterium]